MRAPVTVAWLRGHQAFPQCICEHDVDAMNCPDGDCDLDRGCVYYPLHMLG